jgi:hypothetical protein
VAITPLLQYQGRMTNPTTGQPVADGVYAVTFSLYDVASGGAAKWTETKNVPVAGGLFSTALGDTTPLPQSLFSGQALWLGIKVGSDLEATPRQAIVPVAYALSLVPGAAITGSLASPALRVANTGGPALVTSGATTLGGNVTINGTLSGGTHAHNGADINSGTVADARVDAAVARDSEIMPTVLANDGAGSTLDADLLDGLHANVFALGSHTHDGSAITTGAVADARIDPVIARDAEVAASYYNMPTADNRFVNVTGPESMSANTSVPGLTVTQNGSGSGIAANSTSGSGVYGSSATANGVYGVGNSTINGSGLYGTAPFVGVWGTATGTTGRWGGYFNSQASTGIGVMGVAASITGTTYGVYGSVTSPDGYAGYFDGNVKATGEVRGQNTALPIAYGFVNSNGTLAKGSPNVSSTWSGSNYEITITGENYFWTDYVTQVTLTSGCDYRNSARTGSVGGKLLVDIYGSTGVNVQCYFQFVTYKP